MPDPRLIVTGGAGLIGAAIVRALNRRGRRDITVVDNLNHPAKQANLDALAIARYVDKTTFRESFLAGDEPAPEAVLHLGACSSTTEQDVDYLDDNNRRYTRQLCDWALSHGARFVYASSAATYGDGSLGYADDHALLPRLQPLNHYGQSKHRFDLEALHDGLLDRIVGLKYFNVYGPGEDHKGDMRSVVHKAFHEIRATGALRLFRSHRPDYADGEQVRDFVFVEDAAEVTLFCMAHPEVNGIFNCGTGRARSWLELAHAVFAAMGRAPDIQFIDMPEAIREKYQYYTQAEPRKLRAAGFEAPFTPLEKGVRRYVQTLDQG